MDNKTKEALSKCVELLEQIRSDFPWQISYAHHFAALAYTCSGKTYGKERLLDIKRIVYSNAGLFSVFRSQWFFTAVILDNYYSDPEEAIGRMLSTYRMMKQEQVVPYNYSIITDHVINSFPGNMTVHECILKTRDIYLGMKKHHPMLTSWEDYPLAAMLAITPASADDSVENMEACYRTLNERGLPKGNGIQFLSHILCLSDESRESKCGRVIEIYEELKRKHLRLYSTYFGALGILALLEKSPGETIETVSEMVEEFRHTRHFRWLDKGMHVLFAATLMARGVAEQASSAVTGVTMEIIMQAQIAAIVTASCAATAAAAAASSS